MRYFHFSAQELPTYPVVLLVPTIKADEIRREYVDDFLIHPDEVLVMELHYSPDKKKTPKAEMKRYVSEVLDPIIRAAETQYLVVADSDYFKALTGVTKTERYLGYVMPCLLIPGSPTLWVVYVPNYRQIFYDPLKVRAKIQQGIRALVSHMAGTYEEPGNEVMKFSAYPRTPREIGQWLDHLLKMDVPLSIDIEGFSLKHHQAGIGTISIAWSKHEGIAFPVDYLEIPGATKAPFGTNRKNTLVRGMLRGFFKRLRQRAIYHNIAYDAYVLIYQLFMEDILDTEGMLQGMDVLLRDWDCTRLIAYLATNSCAGNKLGLKDLAQEFAGNYALGDDLKDICGIPLEKLLQYNLVDALSTWFVHEKHFAKMVNDDQYGIYTEVFQPATQDIIQMQLTGLPIDMRRVAEVRLLLEADENQALNQMTSSFLVQRFTYQLNENWAREKNLVLKKKRVTVADGREVFNPNSGPQLQALLYEMLGLPVLSLTDSKQPSTDGETIKALKHHTQDPEVVAFLGSLANYKAVSKILTSFIPAMENAAPGPDGWHYLFGNFNLGGALSGRLSSSDPNLQNLPAKSRYGKLIKSCIVAPPGWIFCGLDFESLEDKISGLTTRDPNKLRVYIDGYDGHSLRTFAYWPHRMPDIVDSVTSINSIGTLYKPLREASKTATFALTYQGTWKTLVTNSGFSEQEARLIEASYHRLYTVSDKWVAERLDEASRTGYITGAFGLRVRTPLLAQVIRGNRKTPYEAEAEGRSAGNALGQSWCLLNSRAASEFMGKVRDSDYQLDIRPCAQIHDAQYYLVREDLGALAFVNEHLVRAVQWQDHPDIAHDQVRLGGEVSIFHPSWASEITIPNHADQDEILKIIRQAQEKQA